MYELQRIQQQIAEILLRRFDLKIDSYDVDLLETRILDSLRIVDFVLELEQSFRVSLPFETLEVEHFRTLAQIAVRIAESLLTLV